MLETPIVFLIFNRPVLTARVFQGIAAARPKQLLIVADGPRADRPEDDEQCRQSRTIVERVDWTCDVQTRFSATNLGCGKCVSGGLNWAFERCERAIILEDDCLPHPDFFSFCQRLLDRYADNPRIAHISGDHFHGDAIPLDASYYFSRFPHVWGWATWRRAWQRYSFAMSDWPSQRDEGLITQLFADAAERQFWKQAFNRVHSGQIDTWDTQWSYSLLLHEMLAINPARNLISNLGFGADATHTRGRSWMSEIPAEPLDQWRDPQHIIEHRSADARTFDVVFDGARLRQKLLY